MRQFIDRKPSVRERLISALLFGGNVEVAEGSKSNGDFRHIPGCVRKSQLGCTIAFSTFNAPSPPMPASGESARRFFTLDPARDPATRDILCTNPAALGGGAAAIDTVFPSEPFAPGTTIGAGIEATGIPDVDVSTPWLEFRGAYSAQCASADDADVLQLTSLGGAPALNAIPDANWGLHLTDANIALGNLSGSCASRSRFFSNKPIRRAVPAYTRRPGYVSCGAVRDPCRVLAPRGRGTGDPRVGASSPFRWGRTPLAPARQLTP